MEPVTLLGLFAGLWVLAHFWIVPLLQSGWQAKDLRQKVAQAGLLAASEKLRDASGAGLIALILVVFLVWLFNLSAGVDQVMGQSVVRGLSSLQHTVSNFAKSWATFIVWVGILGSALALYLVARNAKSRAVAEWTARTQQVFELLSEDPNLLADYADDPELSELIERTSRLLVLLAQMGESEEYLAERQQVGVELNQLFSLCAMEIARKELDLEKVLTIQEKEGFEDQPNLVVRVLASKRFAADLELVNRPLSMLVTALLVISLIGWTSEPLADSMRLAVNNLRVHSLHDNLERELLTAIQIAELHEDELIDSDDADLSSAQRVARVSQQIARISLQQMMRSGILERSADVQFAKHSQAEFVRANILQQHIQSPTSRADRLRAAATETIGPQFHEPEDVLRHIERDLTPKLEALERRDPRLLTQLRQHVVQRYGAPMGALDAQGNLIARIIGQSIGPAVGGLNNELAKQGADIAKEIGEKAIGKWARAHASGLVTEALLGQAQREVVASIKAFGFELSPESENLVRELSSASGRGWGPSPPEATDQSIARKVAQSVAKYSPEADRAAIVRNLGGYSEIFPAVVQGIGEGIAQAARQSVPRRSMSTNFRMASRSFRVRGVLAGRDLEADDLNVTGFWWKVQDDREISISVKNAGTVRDLGVFDAGVLNQALRYAADQRVVAATITPVEGRVVSRVTYLHPVLTDTPLGCRIIEADRFVDTFTLGREDSPVDPQLQDVSNHRRAIERWLEFADIAETIARSEKSCPAAQIQKVVREGVVVPDELEARFRDFIASQLDDEASLDLIEQSLTCAAGDAESAGECLCSRFTGHRLASRYWFPEDHTSQFREREHRLDAVFEFVALSDDALRHVDLWLHTTFAIRDRYEGAGDESTAEALDFSVDQLTRVNKILKDEKIPAYLQVQLHMSANEFLVPIEQFLVLQRFFRAVFNSQLGDRFPLGRLIELQRETRPFVEYQPTIRWEPVKREQRQFLQALSDAGEDALSLFINYYRDWSFRLENKLPRCGPASFPTQ